MLKMIPATVLISLALLQGKPSAVHASDADPANQPDGGQRSMPAPMEELLGEPGMEWNTFLAVQAAAAEALRHGVKLENCRITAAEEGELLFVMFGNPNPSYRDGEESARLAEAVSRVASIEGTGLRDARRQLAAATIEQEEYPV